MKRAMQKTIIKEQLEEYLKANLSGKTKIISSVFQVTGMHRKAIIRAFNREQLNSSCKAPPKLGRPKYYTIETNLALSFLWEQYDFPSAERLHPEVGEAVRIFRRDGMWRYDEETTKQLRAMSLGSMKVRCVELAKKKHLCRGIGTTRASEILRSVPVFFGSWKNKTVGHGQVDTVVHSGPKLMGAMAYTVR